MIELFFMHVALYQPDIPQNLGALFRLCACFKTTLHIIQPCSFSLADTGIKRAGMDYVQQTTCYSHQSWEDFIFWVSIYGFQTVLLSTRASDVYTNFRFDVKKVLLFGRESAGVPEHVHKMVNHKIKIPIDRTTRSLNLALSAAIVLGEALRQTRTFP